jgi:hypothetical protein
MTPKTPMLRPALAVAFLLALTTTAAMAQPRHMEASGESLAIDSPCATAVTIQPDPGLHGKFVADATADHPEEIAQLAFESGATAKLRVPADRCWKPAFSPLFQQTLTIALHVPPGTAMSIEESGGAKYTIGPVGGKLALSISGGVELRAVNATDVTLDLSGGGSVTLGQINGSLKADVSGGGDIHIDHGTLPDLTLSMSGGGSFALAEGAVKRMALDVSGAGSVHVGATVGDATVDLSGAGDVQIAKVTGALTKNVDGMGSINVGSP